jgi:hypothetical protein
MCTLDSWDIVHVLVCSSIKENRWRGKIKQVNGVILIGFKSLRV